MEFNEKLLNILIQMGLENPKLEMDETPAGRFGGFIISNTFAGISHIERQNMIWDKLDEVLDEEKRLKIIGLLTMTPEEVEEADAFE